MSCHSNPGNRAVLSIARHTAATQAGHEIPIPEREAQQSFHTLLREGRSLKIETPQREEVERWFDEAEYQAASVIPRGRSRSAALSNLEHAWDTYHNAPENLGGETFHAWKHTPSLLSYTKERKEHPDPKRIAVDLDGCLYDFNTALREWLVARGWERESLPDPKTYSLSHSWDMHRDTLHSEMATSLAAGVLFRYGDPHTDAVPYVREIGLHGHRLVVNTARNFPGLELEARRATIQWLRDHHIHADEVAVVGTQGGVEKTKIHFDLLIDDAPDNVHAALQAGRKAILLDREWNRDTSGVTRMNYSQIWRNIDQLA